jgi:hypothetical protein
MKLKRVRLVRYIAHIGGMRNPWNALVGKPAEMRPLEIPRRRYKY